MRGKVRFESFSDQFGGNPDFLGNPRGWIIWWVTKIPGAAGEGMIRPQGGLDPLIPELEVSGPGNPDPEAKKPI